MVWQKQQTAKEGAMAPSGVRAGDRSGQAVNRGAGPVSLPLSPSTP